LNGKILTEEELMQRTKKHTIIINNKEIQISEESFQNPSRKKDNINESI